MAKREQTVRYSVFTIKYNFTAGRFHLVAFIRVSGSDENERENSNSD